MTTIYDRALSMLTRFAIVGFSAVLTGCVAPGGGGNPTPVSGTTETGVREVVPGAREGNIRVVQQLPPPPGGTDGAQQPIAENDVIEIDVFQVDDLDRTAQVDARGMINLPLVGEVKASGKSARQLSTEIEQLYGANYLQSPQVSVFVKESVGQRVTVDGEVKKAGIFPVTTSSSLLDVIAQSGGLSDISDPAKIFVFRRVGGETLVANYNVKSIREGKQPNPTIYGGDKVVVFASSTKIAMQNLKDVLGVARGAAAFIP